MRRADHGPQAATWHAEPWPAADALFHRDPRWRGGDAVWSIDLGGDRTLWLFGDSFIAAPDATSRRGAAMVRNSLAITTGHDLPTAAIAFAWREVDGKPASFFAEDGDAWFWPGHGARVGDRLLLLQWRIVRSDQGLGFAGAGWRALVVTNPDDPPAQWRSELCRTSDRFDAVPGAAVASDATHVYAFTTGRLQPGPTRLLRWSRAAIASGDLRDPEWCIDGAWRAEHLLRELPGELVAVGQTEFGVVAGERRPWLLVQTVGFGGADLAWRTADAPTGPWSPPTTLWAPPDRDRDGLYVYAAKVHPMLHTDGADLVASYSTNHRDFATLVGDETLYYPRFLKLTRR